MPTAIAIADLPGNLVGRFEGRAHGSSVSFFVGHFPPGTGHIVVVPAETPHKFVSSAAEGMRMVSITPSGEMVQEWLED